MRDQFASLQGNHTSASLQDKWGFIPGEKCECGSALCYRGPSLERRYKVLVKVEGEVVTVPEAIVCDCGAVYTRGKNITSNTMKEKL